MQKGRVGSWVCSEMECFNNVNFLLLVWYFTCFISLFSLLFDVFVSSNNFDNGLGNMGKGIGCGLLGWKYKSGNVKSSDLSQLLSLSFLNQALLPFCTVNLSLQHISIRMLNEVSVNYRKKVGRLTHGQVNPTKEWNFYNCFLICSLLVKKTSRSDCCIYQIRKSIGKIMLAPLHSGRWHLHWEDCSAVFYIVQLTMPCRPSDEEPHIKKTMKGKTEKIELICRWT